MRKAFGVERSDAEEDGMRKVRTKGRRGGGSWAGFSLRIRWTAAENRPYLFRWTAAECPGRAGGAELPRSAYRMAGGNAVPTFSDL